MDKESHSKGVRGENKRKRNIQTESVCVNMNVNVCVQGQIEENIKTHNKNKVSIPVYHV